jgi:two-component system, NarL family, response regulator DevR
MDVRLPGDSGVAACRDLCSQLPDTKVLMLTASDDEAALLGAIDGGASGYVLKHADSAELAGAVRRVACGESYLDPAVAPQLLDHLRQPQAAHDDPLERLTATEQRILRLLATGLTNREIATELGYAESTVKNYVSSILAKLEVCRRTQAAAYVFDHDSGRVPPTPQQLGNRKPP